MPSDFALLSGYCARFEYGASDVRLRSRRPILELAPDGELIAVRFNNRSTAALSDIPFDVMADYYRACRRMAELAQDSALTVRYRLQPGDVLVMDNLRVLHGRESFSVAILLDHHLRAHSPISGGSRIDRTWARTSTGVGPKHHQGAQRANMVQARR